jgi:4'-phosphopantetheinyl transferase
MPGAPTYPIASETAHLWFLETETLFRDPSATDEWLARLEDHERIRYAACGIDAARREYLGTRALVRTALAHYSGRPPECLRFRTDPLGRPELTSPVMPGLRFSLAKTRELAVGLFAFDHEVGVDVELVAPIDAVEMAGHYFSPGETAELSRLEEAARLSRFYELWTLREAYLKARGIGLDLPLDQLVFRPTPSGEARAEFGPAIRDDAVQWQFGLARLTDRHLAATCIRRPSSGGPMPISRFDARGPVFPRPPTGERGQGEGGTSVKNGHCQKVPS